MAAIFAVLVALGLIFLALLYSSFSWGCVMYFFYGWFILPIFPEAPHLAMMQLVGISFFLNALLRGNSHGSDDKKDEGSTVGVALALPWLVLFLGWLFKTFLLNYRF